MDNDSMESTDQENNNTTMFNTTQQRKLCYRELLNQVEDIHEREELGLQTCQEIGDIIRKVNSMDQEQDISERYQYPEETLLDSMVLSSASSVLVKCIESIDVNSTSYVPAEFTAKIMSYCKGDDSFEGEDLLKLLPDVQSIIPQAAVYSFTYGAYDMQNLPQPKEKRVRQKRAKEQFERKEPEKVTNIDKEEKGIEEIVKTLHDVLTECYQRNNERAIRYYDYVIDTSSFANTVENIFYCAFLVRDGRAHIDLNKKGEPYIKPIKKRELKDFRDRGGVNSQIISTISIPEWETFKKDGYIQTFQKHQQRE